jgi:hypothetical protein
MMALDRGKLRIGGSCGVPRIRMAKVAVIFMMAPKGPREKCGLVAAAV